MLAVSANPYDFSAVIDGAGLPVIAAHCWESAWRGHLAKETERT